MHISTRRQEKWRNRQASQNNETDEKNTRENIMGRLEIKRAEELTRSHNIEFISK
jgi:hypothetical protein